MIVFHALEAHEPTVALCCLGALCLYHAWFFYRLKNAPKATALGRANYYRGIWVQAVMSAEPNVIAVQTMRNWIMAASFLASTAVLLSLAMLSVAFSSVSFSESSNVTYIFGNADYALVQAKFLIVATDLFFVFFSFTIAIREFNHAGFIIELPPESDPNITPQNVAVIVNRGALFNNMGMRGYYLSIPLVCWILHPGLLVLGTLFLLLVLMKLDHML